MEYFDYINNLSDNMQQNPNTFWGIMKMKNKNKRLPDVIPLNVLFHPYLQLNHACSLYIAIQLACYSVGL